MADSKLMLSIVSKWDGAGVKAAEKAVAGLEKTADNLKNIAKGALVGAGAAVTAFTKESITAFNSFEEGMAQTFTLLPAMSDKAMKQMMSQARQFAVEVGRTPQEVAAALYDAIGSGVELAQVWEFMETASGAALGGVAELGVAVDALTSITNAYGEENITAAQASDILFQTMNVGKSTLDELGRTLYNVVPIAAATGVAFEEIGASIATMTAQGTPTAVAMTQLRQLISDLTKEGSKAADFFKEFSGQSFTDFIASGGTLYEVLQIMEKGAEASGLAMVDLFRSIEAGQAAMALSGGNAELFAQNLELMGEAAGSTQNAVDKLSDTGAQSMREMGAAWEDLKISFGEFLTNFPIAAARPQEIAQNASEVFRWLSGNYEQSVEELISGTAEAGDSVEELIDAGQRLKETYEDVSDTLIKAIVSRGSRADMSAEIQEVIELLAQSSGSLEEFRERIKAAFGEDALVVVDNMGTELIAIADITYNVEDAWRDAQPTLEEFNASLEDLGQQGREAAQEQRKLRDVMRYGQNLEELARAGREVASSQEEITRTAAMTEEQMERLSAAFGRTLEAMQTYNNIMSSTASGQQSTISELLSAYDDLEAAQGQWVTVTETNAEEIAKINEELAGDLTEEQKEAWQKIKEETEEGGAAWLEAYNALQNDLSASSREALIARRAELMEAGDTVKQVYTGDFEAAEEAQRRIEEANAAISRSYREMAQQIIEASIAVQTEQIENLVQAGAMTRAEADLAIQNLQDSALNSMEALGLISEAEAELMRQTMDMNREIGNVSNVLTKAFLQDGYLSRQEATLLADAIKLIEDGALTAEQVVSALASNGLGALISQAQTGTQAVGTLKDTLLEIPTTVDVAINITSSGEIPSLPGVPGPGGKDDTGATPFSTGGVVKGLKKGVDSVPALLMPDEVVINAKAAQRFPGGPQALDRWLNDGMPPPADPFSEVGPGPGLWRSPDGAGRVYQDQSHHTHHYYNPQAAAMAEALREQANQARRNAWMGEG